MAKWEYLKLSAWFSGNALQGITIRLSPKRDSHAKLLASIGLKALEKDPALQPPTPAYDTVTTAPWESCGEKFYALIDAVTAEGWEPFEMHEEHSVRVMHLRRQTA
jgi:hypothetical protein